VQNDEYVDRFLRLVRRNDVLRVTDVAHRVRTGVLALRGTTNDAPTSTFVDVTSVVYEPVVRNVAESLVQSGSVVLPCDARTRLWRNACSLYASEHVHSSQIVSKWPCLLFGESVPRFETPIRLQELSLQPRL
jgi:hypothetical protein